MTHKKPLKTKKQKIFFKNWKKTDYFFSRGGSRSILTTIY
jgi:hypothetical protein